MRRAHGFTLLELAVTMAIVVVVATIAYGVSRASYQNASLGSITFDLGARLSGLRFAALSEQEDYVFVVIDAPNASACRPTSPSSCGKWFLLRAPDAGFSLSGFLPGSPGQHATLIDSGDFPRRVKLHLSPSGSPPAPFSTIAFFGSDLTATVDGLKRFAIRFVRDGSVTGEKSGSASGPWAGYAFALTTDQHGETAAAERKGVVVAFPAGVVRTFAIH
ncbi:MAG TPA: type II secretion system protein [Anaeromyxobacter sp.]|nr:type II secretion system protein [Anaeromyxobacter sp.]